MEKTAMQQLKEKLNEQIKNLSIRGGEYSNGYDRALKDAADLIDAQMLEIEKETIINAFLADSDPRMVNRSHAEEYFSQTFSS